MLIINGKENFLQSVDTIFFYEHKLLHGEIGTVIALNYKFEWIQINCTCIISLPFIMIKYIHHTHLYMFTIDINMIISYSYWSYQ